MPDRFRLRGLLQLRPPRGLEGAAFWLAVWLVLLSLLRLLPGAVGTLSSVLQVLLAIALFFTAIPVIWGVVQRRMLWSLRNRLVLTYLLIGMAPVVLFVTLVMISAYIAAGQFAIHLADSRMQSELDRLAGQSARLARGLSGSLDAPAASASVASGAALDRAVIDTRRSRLHANITTFLDGAPVPGQPRPAGAPLGVPPWALHLPTGHLRGIVLDGDEMYLVAIEQEDRPGNHRISLVSSLPVDENLMESIADGLGRAGMLPLLTGGSSRPTLRAQSAAPTADAPTEPSSPASLHRPVFGGVEPPSRNVADLRVRFLSTLPAINWDSGEQENIPIEVDSRPTLLYTQLFGGSISGIVTRVIRIGLVVLCISFALIELLALWMAVQLSRTITTSVADLYDATLRIDRGDLGHQIAVERDDQLAELSRSFNQMTGSLQRLLKEQKEKERLQNEISIAQEVQANLFPQTNIGLARLELHGVCKPARSVSGDYYDFLMFHEQAHDGIASRRETGVGIAIGDISGKGISAALLMATLHSAVRAYRFASEELLYSESMMAALTASRESDSSGHCEELFESPSRILALLNRHLYRSTQPEKYATLFLAHYNAGSCKLTYSNAGQLPPLVLGNDGEIRRLDRGGTVVGLMDGMHYEEDCFELRPGDIVIAYSDGVTEPENEFGEFGEERLVEIVSRYRNEPLHVISNRVMQALSDWIGAEEQPDDITLVLTRQL